MKKIIVLSSVVLTLAACSATDQQKIFNVQTADFGKASDDNLCSVYGYRLNRSHEAKLELIKRNVFSDKELKMIEQHKIVPGMSECAVKAAYGLSDVSSSTTKFINGDKGKGFVYSCARNNIPFCPYTRIDLVNGKVTKISEVKKK